MILVLTLLQSTILFVLSIVHFNWVLGGKFGFNKALPTNVKGERVLNPSRFDSAIVAIGLLLFATYYLIVAGVLTFQVPNYMLTYAGWAISGIFLLRAIGDFNYIGFFKRIKKTEFAKNDTLYYSPLCLLLAAVGLLIEVL